MRIPVSFLHTSSAAISPLMQYYGRNAPEVEILNQLDDGLLRLLAQGSADVVEGRLRQMLQAGRETYGARVAMVTCSSVTPDIISRLGPEAGIPLFKIDILWQPRRSAQGGGSELL